MPNAFRNIFSLRGTLTSSSLLTVFLVVLLTIGFVVVRFTGASDVHVPLVIGGAQFEAEVVRSEAARQRGLSGRASLDENKAMLFLMPAAGFHGFWMKDMQFPIDIFWIYKGQVVDVKRGVMPQASGEELTVYYPRHPADMVLETVAGMAEKYDIGIGDRVEAAFPQGGVDS